MSRSVGSPAEYQSHTTRQRVAPSAWRIGRTLHLSEGLQRHGTSVPAQQTLNRGDQRMRVGGALAIGILATALIGSNALAQTWETKSETDPFTDMQKAEAWIGSTEGEQSYLGIWCHDRKLEILVGFDEQVDENLQVTSRVGKEEPVTQIWSGSTTGDAVFHLAPSQFLKQLLEDTHKKLAIRVWTKEGTYLVSLFNLADIVNATTPVMEAGCSRYFPKSQ